MTHVLVVDDDADILKAATFLLRDHCSHVETSTSPEAIRALMAEHSFDVILLDMNFTRGATSGAEGFAWLKRIIAADPDAVVVVITAHAGVHLAVEAMKLGASDFVSKPWANERMLATVKSAAALRQSRRVAATAEQRTAHVGHTPAHPLLGTSKAMLHVQSLITRAAPTDANVLILGENGTGKELVARALHQTSLRAKNLFVTVDLGSIAPNLFESELFGHKKGAFTDARIDRIGRFQTAEQGTLFLDELGNLPLYLQPKLLTALEQRCIVPVGGNQSVAVDARVISATNATPEALKNEAVFRQDLLFRLNTIEIHVPALRDRAADIPELAHYFLYHYAKKYNKSNMYIPAVLMDHLQAYHWPGNVRALRHAIERAVILAQGAELCDADFTLPALQSSVFAASAAVQPTVPNIGTDTLNLEKAEQHMVERALGRHNWNISLAAKELGLTRASLYRRMEKYGL